jgi:hypothetical protein
MSRKDLGKMFKLRFDDAGRTIYMLPQDVIDNTRRAFNVSATSLTGYGALGPPSGRYLAPANGPDCIEMVDPGVIANTNTGVGPGDCGLGSLVVTGPMFKLFDVGISKEFPIKGNFKLLIRAELLNAFNIANFIPVAAGGASTLDRPVNNFTNLANYEVTQPIGDPRIAQLVARISW